MDKTVINAVAGSGKTSLIIDNLNLNERIAIITYTINNQQLLIDKIKKRFDTIPPNIHVFGFWEFLYSFCLVPNMTVKIKGIIFTQNKKSPKNSYHPPSYGIKGEIFDNMISKFLLDKKVPYLERIDKFFDIIYIDEVQDIDSYDFDWLMTLSNLKSRVLLVGDYYQKTFSTSKLGNKTKGIMSSIENYKKAFENNGFAFDDFTKINSFRCLPCVCEFITNKLGIHIESARKSDEDGKIYFVNNEVEISKIMEDDKIYKLFYQKSSNYICKAMNWGESKGQTFNTVCVILNEKTYNLFLKDELKKLATATKSKFYVACTRTSGDLYFISEKKISFQFRI